MCLKCNNCCCCSLYAGSLWFAIVFLIIFLILSACSLARYLTVGKALQQFSASEQPKVETHEKSMIVFTFLFLFGVIVCILVIVAVLTEDDLVIQVTLWILLFYMIVMLVVVTAIAIYYATDNGVKMFTALVIFVTMLFCWMLAGWLTVRSLYLDVE